MTGNLRFGFILLLVIGGAVVYMSTFIVHERQLAIKFKLGEIVAGGLRARPVLPDSDHQQRASKFDSRILTMDTPSERFPDGRKEKRHRQLLRQVAHRRPENLFIHSTGGDERRAIARMASIINDELKGKIASKTMREVISGERATIMQEVTDNAAVKIPDLGIELIDVRVKKGRVARQRQYQRLPAHGDRTSDRGQGISLAR